MGTLKIFLSVLEDLVNKENEYLIKKGFINLLLARVISLMVVYMIITIISLLGVYILSFLKYKISDEGIIYILILVSMPITLYILTNFFNREKLISKSFYDLIETVFYTNPDVESFGFFVKCIIVSVYSLIGTLITLLFLSTFSNWEAILLKIENDNIFLWAIIGIHIVIFMTVNVLLLEESNLKLKCLKAKRLFWLWVIILIITFSYFIIKVKIGIEYYEVIFLLVTMLLIFQNAIQNYGLIRQTIENFKFANINFENSIQIKDENKIIIIKINVVEWQINDRDNSNSILSIISFDQQYSIQIFQHSKEIFINNYSLNEYAGNKFRVINSLLDGKKLIKTKKIRVGDYAGYKIRVLGIENGIRIVYILIIIECNAFFLDIIFSSNQINLSKIESISKNFIDNLQIN